jgi:hypothetical protein
MEAESRELQKFCKGRKVTGIWLDGDQLIWELDNVLIVTAQAGHSRTLFTDVKKKTVSYVEPTEEDYSYESRQ